MNMDNFDFDKFIGESINGCKIVKKIDNGATGTVFLAEDEENYLKRAIKIIQKGENSPRQNWEQEIKKSNIIQPTDGVVQYIAHGNRSLDGNEFIFIVWQYINSESLKKIIENGKITIQILIDVIQTALNIFDACKANGIQHSDFHAGNILVEFPKKSGLDKNTRKIWVTDFGYGTFSDEKPPLDDYKGLAAIIKDSIDKIKLSSLEREDRYKRKALKEIFPKYLLDEDPTVADYVRNPSVLWTELNKLFKVKDNEGDYQKSVGDYLAAEFIGDRWDGWRSLFVPKFLGADELFDRNICVLTGLRGCGKTMMFKRLSPQLVSELGTAGIKGENSFICFYLNARNIAEAFPWLPNTEENKARTQVINFFHLKWTIEILQWLKIEINKQEYKIYDFGWLIGFFNNLFEQNALYFTSNSSIGIIDNLIHICNEELIKSKLSGNYNSFTSSPLNDIDYLEKLLEIININTSFSKNRSFYMLLDDYSTPLVTEATQRILNPIIFRRCSDIFFKVSTESTESLLRIGLNGKHLEDRADFKFVELGMLTINYDIKEKRNTISEIFNKRIERSKLFTGKNLDLKIILGKSDLTEIDKAKIIRKDDPKDQDIYYGFDDFCDTWSSDLRELIKIFSEMVSEETEKSIQNNINKNISPVISRKIQNKVFKIAGGRFLHALSIATNPFKKSHASTGGKIEHEYGEKLFEIVTSFQEIAHFVLKNKNSKNQKTNPPKQIRKIELKTTIDELDDEGSELYRGLIRYGVFIRDYRGKSINGSISAVRLYLRSLLIPFCKLTFSKRDNLCLDWKDFNEFLKNPKEFKNKCIKKIEKPLDSKAAPLLNGFEEEKVYVTSDDIE
jgi:serine/threonine protein kinase